MYVYYYLFSIFDTFNLFSVGNDILETLGVVDSEHDEEALPGPHVLVPHGAEFFLTSRVEDVQEAGLSVNHHLLPVAVLYSRVIFLHEVILDQLDCQCRFSHASG